MWTGHGSQACFTLRVWSPMSQWVSPAVLCLSPLLSLHISIALMSRYTVPGSTHRLTRGKGGRKEQGGKMETIKRKEKLSKSEWKRFERLNCHGYHLNVFNLIGQYRGSFSYCEKTVDIRPSLWMLKNLHSWQTSAPLPVEEAQYRWLLRNKTLILIGTVNITCMLLICTVRLMNRLKLLLRSFKNLRNFHVN